MRFALLLAGLLLVAPAARGAETASPDDTAHFLAGMPVPPASPLAALAKDRGWQLHAGAFDAAFNRVEKRQLSKIRAWSSTHLTAHRQTLFYMFSGPDFLYANGFFPDASTYVLAGLEPVGTVPDLTKISRGSVPSVLRTLQTSTRTLLDLSFFKTKNMQTELRASPISGTLPVLYVFLARSGKIVNDVSLVRLDANGDEQPGAGPNPANAVQGVKIGFSAPNGPPQTLYYFSANLANDGFAKGGLGPFCEKRGMGDGLVKSASYLLHGSDFSQVRSFLLKHTATILQDDTGVPATFFDPTWQLKPFGRYAAPISLFPGRHQPKMADLFRKQAHVPLEFGIGYRYRPNESNLLLATKREIPTPSSVAGQTPALPKADGAMPESQPLQPAKIRPSADATQPAQDF